MGLQAQLFEAAKGKQVEVLLAQQGRIVGILESVGADALQLRDGPDDVWVSLAAVVAVRVHARVPEAANAGSKSAAPATRPVTLFCRQCGYERVARELASGEEAPPIGADRAAEICPVCGSTRWTRERPQP
jgi:hypothetical protein